MNPSDLDDGDKGFGVATGGTGAGIARSVPLNEERRPPCGSRRVDHAGRGTRRTEANLPPESRPGQAPGPTHLSSTTAPIAGTSVLPPWRFPIRKVEAVEPLLRPLAPLRRLPPMLRGATGLHGGPGPLLGPGVPDDLCATGPENPDDQPPPAGLQARVVSHRERHGYFPASVGPTTGSTEIR